MSFEGFLVSNMIILFRFIFCVRAVSSTSNILCSVKAINSRLGIGHGISIDVRCGHSTDRSIDRRQGWLQGEIADPCPCAHSYPSSWRVLRACTTIVYYYYKKNFIALLGLDTTVGRARWAGGSIDKFPRVLVPKEKGSVLALVPSLVWGGLQLL